jgi:hypothetical protein
MHAVGLKQNNVSAPTFMRLTAALRVCSSLNIAIGPSTQK